MFKVFLSHAAEDYSLVLRIWRILFRLKAAPYIYKLYPDYRRDIPTGIKDVLRDCALCVSFLTKNGINSQWVQQELGVAYAFDKIIVPVIETGVQYSGFVQMVTRIAYEPTNPDGMVSAVIYAVKTHLIGHGQIPIVLSCPGHHEHDYTLPSTEEINRAIGIGHVFIFKCITCQAQFNVSPRTLELL